jgi:non-heme chloroperoxidase
MPSLEDVDLSTGVHLQCAVQFPDGDRTVLFLHGLSDTWFSFTPVLARLMDDVHCLAPTLRGHGGSDHPEDGYEIANFAEDAAAVLRQQDAEDVVVVGHSFGSFVAQRLALDYPERVDRLILIGSAPSARNEAIRTLIQIVEGFNGTVPDDFVYEFQHSNTHDTLPDIFMDRVIAESKRMPVRVWKQLAASFEGTDFSDELSDISAPTLVIGGDRDAFFSPSKQEALADLIPDASLSIYEDTGHAVHWERPGRFVHDLRRFM